MQYQECYDTLVGQDRFSGVLVKIVAELLCLFHEELRNPWPTDLSIASVAQCTAFASRQRPVPGG